MPIDPTDYAQDVQTYQDQTALAERAASGKVRHAGGRPKMTRDRRLAQAAAYLREELHARLVAHWHLITPATGETPPWGPGTPWEQRFTILANLIDGLSEEFHPRVGVLAHLHSDRAEDQS